MQTEVNDTAVHDRRTLTGYIARGRVRRGAVDGVANGRVPELELLPPLARRHSFGFYPLCN